MTHKKVFSAPDAAPVVIYVKQDENSEHAFPLLEKMMNPGFSIPKYDTQEIDESDANNVIITYKLSGVTVATKLIAISGTTTKITVS